MKRFYEFLPDAPALLALEPEELAGYLMEYLNSLSDREKDQIHHHNYSQPDNFQGYPSEFQNDIARAFMEAWIWLEREGMLALKPGESGGWVFITRRGKALRGHMDVEAFRQRDLLPKKMIHPAIVQKVWSAFIRGEYDTAIFQAFREVEVAVRDAGNFSQDDIGVKLMRKAFDKNDGVLTDKTLPDGERESMAHLFSGAVGLYKNSTSHRNVAIDSVMAVEIIMLASLLLKIVDTRTQSSLK